jgi:hypothetical protein
MLAITCRSTSVREEATTKRSSASAASDPELPQTMYLF